ncbi:MAG TPA: class I SAM-dependent methyltransferase [Nitrospira sp.]|nr:class I SAM-dependent methyltransferase [Nitrospira sp.]
MDSAISEFFELSDFNKETLTNGAITPQTQYVIAKRIDSILSEDNLFLEMCCGGGWLSARLCELNSRRIAFLMDVSAQQARLARAIHPLSRVVLVGDATNIPLRSRTLGAVLCSFAVHLFTHNQLREVALETSRVCADESVVVIVTFLKSDIGQSLFDQFIEGYADVDRARFFNFEEISQALAFGGWKLLVGERIKFAENITVRAFCDMLYSRPFSTFQLLRQLKSEEWLSAEIERAANRATMATHRGILHSERAVSLLVFRKG